MARKFHCSNDPCRSAIACNTFGYCRERNKDGQPVNAAENARRKAESDLAFDNYEPPDAPGWEGGFAPNH